MRLIVSSKVFLWLDVGGNYDNYTPLLFQKSPNDKILISFLAHVLIWLLY